MFSSIPSSKIDPASAKILSELFPPSWKKVSTVRLVGSDRGLKQVEVGGKVINRQKDGTFHVSGSDASLLRKSGDFAVAGITFRNARGFKCQDCGFLGLFPKCKCGSTNTIPDDQDGE